MYQRRLLAKRLGSDPYIGDYKIMEEEIGEGSNAVVRMAEHATTGNRVVCKVLIKKISTPGSSPYGSPAGSPMSPMYTPSGSPTSCSPMGISPALMASYQTLAQKVKDETYREINIMNKLNHENIMKTLQVSEENNYIFIFMDHMDEGDLYSYIQKHGSFEESRARMLFSQMASALAFCHEAKVCHHDIKLENFVIDSHSGVKLIDFGYAIDYTTKPDTESFHVFNGSPAYSAPEILDRKAHDETVDVFSLGICLYYMMSAEFPFCDETRTTYDQLVRNVRQGKFCWPDHFSPSLRDLLSHMIAKRNLRYSWKQILSHPWLNEDTMSLC
ncbi:Kinase, CAMK CAMKL [Planoprotostelium fungivorum]|uniref:non-specific serine/threonine protein kinase n=1 Tax=Planoprotostelium fungivorum TaxID=1890364 RepID=A0A2P6MZM5_9EUKA|nr:Kinase, CAMK CAMKL [Planoprotostelium fungivorum]